MRQRRLVLCTIGCVVGIACGADQARDAVAATPDQTELRAAIAACAAEPNPDVNACRAAVRLGASESGIRLPETESFSARMANAFASEGRYAEALQVYRDAIRRYPLNAQLHYELGTLLVNQFGAAEEALGPFMQAVRHRPQFPEAMLALAHVQQELGYFDDAIARYRATLEIVPTSSEALLGLGRTLAAKGDHAGAIDILERAARMPSASDAVWTALGRSRLAIGNADAASAALRQAIAINPDAHEAFCSLAQALTSLGNGDDARAACRQANRPTAHGVARCACTQ